MPEPFPPGSLVNLGDLSREVGYDVVDEDSATIAGWILDELGERELTLAVAESLTGGMLASTIVEVPGASRVFRGGAVTYATDTKASVLQVSSERLASTGPVDEVVARHMAEGAAKLFGSDLALATTGVAGPGTSDGHPPETVWIGLYSEARGRKGKEMVSDSSQTSFSSGESGKIKVSNGDGGSGKPSALAWRFEIPGERSHVREVSVRVALSLLFVEISTIA